jgi:radical SAM superfamily enzyme YgiQ (UPF0313 family)
MRIVLVGADLEENLGLGMIAAAAAAAGHEPIVLAFDDASEAGAVVDRILARRPSVVGLGAQFQHRAHDTLTMARRLRARGFAGHMTCGGQWATMAWREALEQHEGLDSVVLYEGERTIAELLDALQARRSLAAVPGLAVRDGAGRAVRTLPRPLETNLDALPFPRRYRAHSRHAGIPFIPISGGRGCWGSCAYCSITTSYRDARANGAGATTFRLRSPRNVAAEMAMLWHAAGGPCVFCFHDENFLLPRPADSLRRIREIRAALDDFGVGKAAMIGKCRPDCVTPELAIALRDLGVIRLYVGVENASQRGADHLNRRTQTRRVHEALEALRAAGIFGCYNLLVFEPDATLDDVRENVAFIRRHADHPVNFCRAEPYHGTPLHRSLEARGALGGSHLGWDYRILDDRAEILFRVCSAAFRERNFASAGVANRTMGLGYTAKLVEVFHDDRHARRDGLLRRAAELTRSISLDNAALLEEAIEIADSASLRDEDAVARETARLGLKVAAFDRVWHVALDEMYADLGAYAREAGERRPSPGPTRLLAQAMQGIAVAGALAVGGPACGGQTSVYGNDPAPPDGGYQAEAGKDQTSEPLVADPAPWDAGKDSAPDITVVDMAPPDAGKDVTKDAAPDVVDDSTSDPTVVDMAPPDAGKEADVQVSDPPPPDAGLDAKGAMLIDHWRDTAPRRAVRSTDLPLFDPPAIALVARRDGERVVVTIEGGPEALTSRWQSEGRVEGAGREVVWTPCSPDDQIRVAVRSRGGVAVVALRASEV